MSSPFTTIEAFNSATDGPTEGAIYTFAQAPIFNYIALLVAVALFVWFIVKTYSTHEAEHAAERSVRNSNGTLVPLIVAGLLSLFAVDLKRPSQPSEASISSTRRSDRTQQIMFNSSQRGSNLLPVGLLGIVGVGRSSLRKLAAKKRRRSRSKYAFTKSGRRSR